MLIASIKIVLNVSKLGFGGSMLKSKQSENCVKNVVEWLRAFLNDGIFCWHDNRMAAWYIYAGCMCNLGHIQSVKTTNIEHVLSKCNSECFIFHLLFHLVSINAIINTSVKEKTIEIRSGYVVCSVDACIIWSALQRLMLCVSLSYLSQCAEDNKQHSVISSASVGSIALKLIHLIWNDARMQVFLIFVVYVLCLHSQSTIISWTVPLRCVF